MDQTPKNCICGTLIDPEEHRCQDCKDKAVLESVQEMVPESLYCSIMEEIGESEGGSEFEIVDVASGESQDRDGIKVCVDQRSTGCTGDCYEGYVYVELPNGKFLRWYYKM